MSTITREREYPLNGKECTVDKKDWHIILTVLIGNMQKIGRYKGLSGEEKKNIVLMLLEYELELPSVLEDFTDSLIDLLIAVENEEILINKIHNVEREIHNAERESHNAERERHSVESKRYRVCGWWW